MGFKRSVDSRPMGVMFSVVAFVCLAHFISIHILSLHTRIGKVRFSNDNRRLVSAYK